MRLCGNEGRLGGRKHLSGVLAGLSVAALAMGLSGCGKSEGAPVAGGAAPAIKAVPIRLATVQARDLPQKVHTVGTLAALEKAVLSNRVSGLAEGLYADMGDRVKPGQKLAQIEKKRYELAVQQAEQSLQQTLARLGLEAIPEEKFDVDQTATVKRTLSELNAAQIKFDRSVVLFKQQLMKEFEYLDSQAALRVAETSVQDMREQARALLASAREARTVIELRKRDLNDTAIMAPDGSTPDGQKITSYTVAERRVSSGEYLKEGTMLFTVVADQTLKLQARIPERELAKVQVGQKVEFKVEAYPGKVFVGKVTALDPTVDPSNRTFMAEATVDNTAGELRAGSFVQADIINSQPLAGRITVPMDAVTSFAGVNKIFLIEKTGDKQGKAKQVEVSLGQQGSEKGGQGNWVEVAAVDPTGKAVAGKVAAGSAVATSALSKLVDGSVVEILDIAAGTQPSGGAKNE